MLVSGTTVQTFPAAAGDATNQVVRLDLFKQPIVVPQIAPDYASALDGMHYRACNPTMGTGIAMGIQTTFSDTANVLLTLRNSSSTKMLIPVYIRLINTVAGASTTNSDIAIITDNTTRYSSGGTPLTPVNAHSGYASGGEAILHFGALTCAAASAKRILSRARLKTQAAPCWVIGDKVVISFGDVSGVAAGETNGTATRIFPVICPPVVLGGPNHTLLLHMWNTANATTAPSWEVEVAWMQR